MLSPEYTCLGIDVGYGRMGVAKLTSFGRVVYIDCIETTAKNSFQERLYYIYNKLIELVQDCKIVAYEEPVLRGLNGANLNQVVGVINIVTAAYGIVPIKYSPSAIKQTVTGKGGADKPHVARVLMEKYPSIEPDLLDDSYDALACAYTYFSKNNLLEEKNYAA